MVFNGSKQGFTRLNKVKQYKMGRNLANLVLAKLSRAKDLPNRDKQDQKRLNRLKWGLMVVNRGKLG